MNNNRIIIEKYFVKWQQFVKNKQEVEELLSKRDEEREKLETLMNTLQQYQDNQQSSAIQLPLKKNIVNQFENRYKAQQVLIRDLTKKLEANTHVIDNLKLGLLNDEIMKSMNKTKVDIHEIFKDCSVKIRCKFGPPLDYGDQFAVLSRKIPNSMRQSMERSLKRAHRREIIVERKRAIEEERIRNLREALEKKHALDVEEKRRNLEAINERRRHELLRERNKQMRKRIFLNKLNKAVEFDERNLLRKSFGKLYRNFISNRAKDLQSQLHYRRVLMMKIISNWQKFVEEKYKTKNELADAHFAQKILTICLASWKYFHIESVRAMQVAEDYYDFQLQRRTFILWHRQVCWQITTTEKRFNLAAKHYNQKILFHSFHQWRSLPAVLQLEKAIEEKKLKWRKKVWEILPDYQPTFIY